MVSYPPISTDRPLNGKVGIGSGNAKVERPMGVSRKDGGASKADKAVQDPGLKDYVGGLGLGILNGC